MQERQPFITMPENKKSPANASQSWKKYTESQVHEKEKFLVLLYELCRGVEEPEQVAGRSRLNLKDMIFSICFKVYSQLSARRFMSDLRRVHQEGLISHVHHFNSVSNYLQMASVTPVLQKLIEESSSPLRAVETMFAVDSTGLRVPCRRKWYNRHKKRVQDRRAWRKLHCICGVQTNIITMAEVSDGHANDSPFFKGLVQQTARRFRVSEVSADAGYIAAHNQREVLLLGAVPYIAYRSNSSPYWKPKSSFYKRMLELFEQRKPEFMEHYYRRNNIESTFFMIKARFGGFLRSKSERAQVNEALCKVICHNLCVIIQSMSELGIEPVFYTRPASEEDRPAQRILPSALIQERITALTAKAALKVASENPPADECRRADKSTQPLLPIFEKQSSEPLNMIPTEAVKDVSEIDKASPSREGGKRRLLGQQLLFL
jgi:transposase